MESIGWGSWRTTTGLDQPWKRMPLLLLRPLLFSDFVNDIHVGS